MSRITILHSANTSIAQMKDLVGPIAGYDTSWPQAAAKVRWDHLGNNDVPNLMTVGGDYITGFSSGAFMAMRMLRERQYKAACIVAGGLLENYIRNEWKYPCPVLLINGTADKQVPYEGVNYAYEAGLGAALELVRMSQPVGPHQNIPILNSNTTDKSRAYCDDWYNVKLITVVNGGHTWPGSTHNLSPLIAGQTCMDFSATEAMLAFFKRFP